MRGLLRSVSLVALVLAGPALAEIPDYTAVTAERLTQPEDGNWLQTRRTYDGQGHSPLTQITKDNVAQLTEVWSHPTGPYRPAPEFTALPARGAHQAAAVVNNGVMFMTTPDNQVIAMDAKTGEEFWRYQHPLPEDLVPVLDPSGPWTVSSVSNTGSQLRLILSDASGAEIPADLRRRAPAAAGLAPGVRVHLRPEAGSVFPAETA